MHASSVEIRQASLGEDDEPLFLRRKRHEEATFDITAMIDLVFMLNIFFLVTTVAAAMSELDLPVVKHCLPTDADTAVMVSLVQRDGQSAAAIYLGDNVEGAGIVDPDEQTRLVREAAEAGVRNDKRVVLIKAERNVKLRDVRRIGAAAGAVSGVELRLAVIEKE